MGRSMRSRRVNSYMRKKRSKRRGNKLSKRSNKLSKRSKRSKGSKRIRNTRKIYRGGGITCEEGCQQELADEYGVPLEKITKIVDGNVYNNMYGVWAAIANNGIEMDGPEGWIRNNIDLIQREKIPAVRTMPMLKDLVKNNWNDNFDKKEFLKLVKQLPTDFVNNEYD